MYASLGGFIHRRPWLTLAASAVFLVASLLVLVRGGRLAGAGIAGVESDRAQSVVDAIAGRTEETTIAVVFESADLAPTDVEFTAAMRRALAPLRNDPRVASVTTPDEAPPLMTEKLQNRDARTALAFVSMKGRLEDGLAAWPELRKKIASDRLSITCTGKIPFLADLASVLEHDLVRAELISIPLALLVLLLVFRTVTAATLPVGVGGLAVLGGIALVLALSHVVEVSQYTVNICSLIGFGVAIDYSLFIVSRYREELAGGRELPPRAPARDGHGRARGRVLRSRRRDRPHGPPVLSWLVPRDHGRRRRDRRRPRRGLRSDALARAARAPRSAHRSRQAAGRLRRAPPGQVLARASPSA